MIIALPWLNVANGTLAAYHPLQTATPVISLLSLNLLGKMGFGAFGGFEYVAIHAGECRDPVRSITRATVIAAPIIVLMFILGTSSVLGMIPNDEIDLIAPIPQLLSVGFGPLGARRRDCAAHAERHDRDSVRAGERQLRRQHASADGRRMGQPAAGLVHAAERQVQDAGELDLSSSAPRRSC